ncbi:MAG TPA: ABC transporter permease, partial [Rhodocyclaceae bacterium]|nr:ABC transporter permease [Rhodocyclaceae bacterium]
MNGLSLSLRLAARDMLRDRFFLFCNVAILIGVLVPMMVLYGVKNGVTNALLGDLLSNPSVLQIDTVGNKTFTHAQVEEVGS